MNPKTVIYEKLQPDEVENLPLRVRARLGDTAVESDEWLVLHSSWPFHNIVDRLNRLGQFKTDESQHADASQVLDFLASWLISDSADVVEELVFDNDTAHLMYLKDTPTLTATQIHALSGLTSRNLSEPASRWQKEGRSFGIRRGRQYLYPKFQFSEGRPRTVIKEILSALPPEMTAWQKAFWFASDNGWLGGDKPQERLEDSELVVEAARQLSDLARG